MDYTLIDSAENKSNYLNRFLGLNRTEATQDGEFSVSRNLTSNRYPCMATARTPIGVIEKANIKAVIAPKYTNSETVTGFTGLVTEGGNYVFYYNGVARSLENAANTALVSVSNEAIVPNDTDKITLVDWNTAIIICIYQNSDKSHLFFYDYTAVNEEHHYIQHMEQGFKAITCTCVGIGNPDKDYEVTNYITGSQNGTAIKWDETFKVGDAVFIEGFTNDANNSVDTDGMDDTADKSRARSCIVSSFSSDGKTMYLQRQNYLAEYVMFKGNNSNTETVTESIVDGKKVGVSVYIKIPTMNHICVHLNKLWGTNPNGEYIYASKIGDFRNFTTYQGLASDSYYKQVGTHGGFEGIVSYRDNLVAFKKDYIHHIYGDKPSNYSMPKQLSDCGCIDIRSCVQVGTTLFFLGYNGFYAYTGGQPELISQKLDRKYKKAVAMTDGIKYIVSAVTEDGEAEFLTFDTRYGTWHTETVSGSPLEVVGSFRWHDKLYIATGSEVYLYGGGDTEDWECESTVIHDDIFDNKGVIELWIRAKLDDDTSIDVYTSEEDGEWIKHGTMTADGLKVYRVPVRFITGEFYRWKLVGQGHAVIHSIEKVVSSGGRYYRSAPSYRVKG